MLSLLSLALAASSKNNDIPAPLIVLGALAVALMAAGTFGYIVRHRRQRRWVKTTMNRKDELY